METQKEAIARLCKEVTTTFGQPLKIRKDFETLANSIFEKTCQNVSASTLMRIFGYTKSNSLPNISTLDLLAVYAGYSDFVSFVGNRYLADVTLPSSEPKDEIPESAEIQDPELSKSDSVIPEPLPDSKEHRAWLHRPYSFLAIPVLLIFAIVAWHYYSTNKGVTGETRILHLGQHFDSYDDYLPLFGITTKYERHCAEVPEHPGIVVWAPQYHHPCYHNDGDSAAMMPTIAEYYTALNPPTDSLEAQSVIAFNKDRYYQAIENNEVRCVFMKNLVDTGFIFLGVYRFYEVASNIDSVIWIRVADTLDLSNLGALRALRN